MGTAKGSFHDRKGNPLVPVSVAGKTGTLSATTDKGYVGYSWFVGYAPADNPEIAFAVVLGNPAAWRIRAAYVGRRTGRRVCRGQARAGLVAHGRVKPLRRDGLAAGETSGSRPMSRVKSVEIDARQVVRSAPSLLL